MPLLSELSGALSGIVEAIGPSVVRVEARRRLPASGIVWASEGLVVTADHAIEHDEHIRIGLARGQTVPASLVGRDPTTDIAVLRAEAGDLTPPAWADPTVARAGHLVIGLGRPGRTIRARLGMLSAVAEGWRTPGGAQIEPYLEVDVSAAPGFSGGPLADVTGRVLGMNTTALLRRTALTLPVTTLRRVVDTLVTYGRVRRGYLGIGAQPVRLPTAMRQGLGQEAGLLLISVESGSPADLAGLMLGDVILGFGDGPMGDVHDLMSLLTAERIGASVPVRVLRGGAVREMSVVVGERR